MKTLKQIKADIDCLDSYYLNAAGVKKKAQPPIYISRGKYAGRKQELEKCLRYIETNPNKDFLKKQLSMVEKEIKIVDARYEFYNPREIQFKSELAKRKYYDNLFDLPKLKTQKRTLKYLLCL